MASPRGKTARKTAQPTATMVAPSGGTLRVGNPGNSGGSGAPSSIIRARCRGSFAARIAILERIADGKPVQKVVTPAGTVISVAAPIKERVRAIDILGKYGGIEKVHVEFEDKTPQMVESGEVLMRRLAQEVVPRFAALLQQDQRLRMLKAITGAEVVVESPR